MNNNTSGVIFSIQRYSVHDGEGIRTIVFLKGCPLRCRWCSNPESQNFQPERAFNPGKCLGLAACNRCTQACPQGAIAEVDGLPAVDPERCIGCLECLRACPAGAMHLYGERKTPSQVLDQVERDGQFYARSGGGMTLSGGEALSQPEFTLALLDEARQRHISCAIETSGCAPWDTMEAACSRLNELIYDVKCIPAEKHLEFTSVDNRLILENLAKVCRTFPDLPLLVRTPVVPGFNDTPKDIRQILDVLPRRRNLRFELLAYHRLGSPKYAYLGRNYAMGDRPLDAATFQRLQELAASWRT